MARTAQKTYDIQKIDNIEKKPEDKIFHYPNSVSSELHINLNKSAQLSIYTMGGKLEIANTLKQGKNIINICYFY